MQNTWYIVILGAVVLYLYYNLFTSIKKEEITWNIFKYKKKEKPFVFWLAWGCQFTLATMFLAIAILYTFFHEELLSFLIKIS